MPDYKGFFEESVFTYYITDSNKAEVDLEKKAEIGKWNIYASDKTDVRFTNDKTGTNTVIIGYCVDSHMEFSKDDVCSYLSGFENDDFQCALSRLGGKFVIVRIDSDGIDVYTDATATLPVFYCKKEGYTHISSLEYFIKENADCAVSQDSLQILKMSDGAKTLPGKLTHYESIFSLLPNHYYSSVEDKAVRYGKKNTSGQMSSKEAAKKTEPLICNILNQISKDYLIKCPLTGGYDSRVVLSALEHISYGDPGIYTMRHAMDETDSDISIPKMIARDKDYDYRLIEDAQSSDDYIEICNFIMGKEMYSARTLNLVYTLKDHLGNACLLNGDIMGQIGKSSLHRSIRECFMGPRYYQCKVHNTSKYSLKEIKEWYKSVKEYGVKNICDKFSKEIRLGRWAADENSLYSLFGINVINIFNSTEIIDIWECVPRSERKLSLLHKELIGLMCHKLLEYGFGAEKLSMEHMIRKSDITFYIATFAKYYIQYLNNLKRRR